MDTSPRPQRPHLHAHLWQGAREPASEAPPEMTIVVADWTVGGGRLRCGTLTLVAAREGSAWRVVSARLSRRERAA